MFKLIILKSSCYILLVLSILIPKLRKLDAISDWKQGVDILFYERQGASIGNKSVLYDVLLSSSSKGDKFVIGDNCTLTGCTLLGHDASPTLFLPELLNKEYPWQSHARRSYRSPIVIGNNVFVGYGCIILPGVTIGNNVVISAGSIVTKDLKGDAVYGGNPAKLIKTIDSFKDKYKEILMSNPDRF